MIDLEVPYACTRQPRRARVVTRAEDHDLTDREAIDREIDEAIEICDAQREPRLHRRKPHVEPLRDLVTFGSGERFSPRIDEQRLVPTTRARAISAHHQRG